MKRKILTLIGTRPELIKLSETIRCLDNNFNHTLVHTGQNSDFELNKIFFKNLKLRKPNYFFNCSNGTSIEKISKILIKTEKIVDKIKPDSFLIYGDTESCLSAIVPKKKNIPIFHLEAGNRCFDQRVPEESNRKIIDHISDINITISERAKDYLVNEGLNPHLIYNFGSPLFEIITKNLNKINKSKILSILNLKPKKYILFSVHRHENVDFQNKLKLVLKFFAKTYKKYKLPIIVSTHPRLKKKLTREKFNFSEKKIKFLKPFGYFDYMKLQKDSFCTVSDSGTISEDSSILNFPAINLRETHERPEAMDYGSVIMSGLDPDNLIENIRIQTNKNNHMDNEIPDYSKDNFSKKLINLITSYIPYVNEKIYSK